MKNARFLPAARFLAAISLLPAALHGTGANHLGANDTPPGYSGENKWERLGNIKWVFVAAGKFKMGSENGKENEKPAHDVTVMHFYISTTEVTFEQYDMFCDSTGRKKASDDKWGRGNRPVINISWYDAVAYCRWLFDQTGDSVHLPTEAEYESAARGGQMSGGYEFSGGDDIGEVAWYIDNSNLRTHEVEMKHGNELGLYDMSGNVWEWCVDSYHPSYEGAPTDGSAWLDADSATQPRVVRGGSWYDFAEDCRVTSRDGLNPASWNYVVGFRTVRGAE